MTTNDLSIITHQILSECYEDYVGLWSIVRSIRDADVVEQGKVMETTVTLLAELLSQGKIIAGQFVDHKFQEWKMNPQDIIAKIEREWKHLGRDPDIGEIAWFVAVGAPI